MSSLAERKLLHAYCILRSMTVQSVFLHSKLENIIYKDIDRDIDFSSIKVTNFTGKKQLLYKMLAKVWLPPE